MKHDLLDTLVIGGGPAGLTAALYLGRYRRRVRVVDAGDGRMANIPCSRNIAGFPDGIGGGELLARMRQHAERFGAQLVQGRVDQLHRTDDGFTAICGGDELRARFVVLATGARDVEADIGGLPQALQAGLLRYCPVCDGFETEGQRVAVLGKAGHGLRESLFVAGFANEVTWLCMDTQDEVETSELARLRDAGVRIAGCLPRHIHCDPGQGVVVELADGGRLRFDTLYAALGLHHCSELATALGAEVRPDGQLVVDDHMQTTVPGLYAAGDVAVDLNQVGVAIGHAAIAATAIHNRL